MTTRRETAYAALFARLETLVGPLVTRAEVLPDEIPAGGLVNLREGEAQLVDETNGVVTRHWSEQAQIELIVQKHGGEARATLMDDLAAAVAVALNIDPDAGGDVTLGGAVDYAQAHALEQVDDLPIAGAEAVKAAILPVEIDYTTGRNPMEAV